MKNTECLPAIGYAFRRDGRASRLANLGIQKAYPLYIFCWQIILEPTSPFTTFAIYPLLQIGEGTTPVPIKKDHSGADV